MIHLHSPEPAALRQLLFPDYRLGSKKEKRTRLFLCSSIFFLAFSFASAQTSANHAVFTDRLCKTWKIEKMIQGDKISKPDAALDDFVLIINEDHTILQGMNPDGLIKGTWTFDEKSRILAVKDNETSSYYDMKIISCTADELVLQDMSSDPSLTIYYGVK